MAMAVIQVGMSPQAGGRCHGEPKMSIATTNPAIPQAAARAMTRPSLSEVMARLLLTRRTLQAGTPPRFARCDNESREC